MKASLNAIQYMWWTLIGLALVLMVHSGFALGDVSVQAALTELQVFQLAFDGPTVSQSLSEAARAPGRIPLQAVAEAFHGPQLPRIRATAGSVAPLGQVTLSTLADAQRHTAEVPLTIGLVDPHALAESLAFYLRGREDSLQLTSVNLEPTANPPSDAALILSAERARHQRLAAKAIADKADATYERWVERFQKRRAANASRKVMQRLRERLSEARRERLAARRAFNATEKAYKNAAEQVAALAPRILRSDANPGNAQVALATLTLRKAPTRAFVDGTAPTPISGQGDIRVKVLTPLTPQTIMLPVLSGVSFEHTQAAGLWSEVANLTPAAAIERVNAEFSPFSKRAEIYGLQLGAPLVLHFGPLLLLLLLMRIIHKARHCTLGYNPFGGTPLPTISIGLGFKPLNIATLTLLPAVTSLLCAAALNGLDQWPVFALPAGVLALGLGVWAYLATEEAQNLSLAIARTSTLPPPPHGALDDVGPEPTVPTDTPSGTEPDAGREATQDPVDRDSSAASPVTTAQLTSQKTG